MLGGYMGKILRVDLSTQEILTETFQEEILRKYLGGSGLGAKILLEETTEKTDPLGPDNILIFMTGPLVGTRALNFGRHQVVTKSPLTGIYGEANSGGTWGVHLKRAGYDGLIISGRSSKPVYLWLNNDIVQIRDASSIWGKDTFETDLLLKRELGSDIVTCSIGQAGENLVKIAAIMNDGIHGRAAARCGVGAVMGSKKLKAIAVKGDLKPYTVNEKALKKSIRNWSPKIRENTLEMNKFGTSEMMLRVEASGDLPIKNWTGGIFSTAEKISGQTISKKLYKKRYYCAQCVIGCGKTIQIKDGPYAGLSGAGPEYETLGMLGANCLIDDVEAISKANELCNRYGLDTISTGAVIAFAMEAYERGLINKNDTAGFELHWGNNEALLGMIHKITYRENIGELLGEGVRIAAKKLGGLAQEFALHVKGLELPGHDPRAKYSNTLAYATSPRGACHMNAFSYEFENGLAMPELGYPETLDRFETEGKAEFVAKFQNLMAIFDSLIGCKFLIFGLKDETIKTTVKWLNFVTGWDITPEELLETGERIVTLKRLYNIRCGKFRNDDTLPPRILNEIRGAGGAAEGLPHLGKMLNEYYRYRGWNEFGIPKRETLKRLALL